MAFGQQSGPPATARQMSRLGDLLLAAGHVDFRDARGPLGLTQRQAGGKFTRDEADTLIEQLEVEVEGADAPTDAGPDAGPLAGFSSEVLAAELQRRGWAVIAP
jgi:hypothetical protein